MTTSLETAPPRFGTIGVVGAGVMGIGLAQSLAQTEHNVILIDVSEEALIRAERDIAANLRHATLFDAALRAADHAAILARIKRTTDYQELSKAEFVIENSTEDLTVKQVVYPLLDRVCRTECVLAANTSAIAITQLASLTRRPAQVIGMHFMNPVPQKPVVEVIRGWHSSDATVTAAQALLAQMGKRAIVVKDLPGFVSNRVLMLTINEAIGVVQDGVADAKDVDAIFVQCFSHRMGPLATADLIGLDTILRSLDVLQQSYGAAKYRPNHLLKQMVDAGLLGRKSGQGFFRYRHLEAR